jgi:hypothetical protein
MHPLFEGPKTLGGAHEGDDVAHVHGEHVTSSARIPVRPVATGAAERGHDGAPALAGPS